MPKRPLLLVGALALLVVAIALTSCKSSNPTNPYGMNTTGGGGGGGGGGTALELNGSLAASGGQYTHTFMTAGTFNYHCTIHPSCTSLAGTIVVLPSGGTIRNRILGITQSGGTSGYYGTTCSGLSLQLDSVFVGDMVTWTNNSPFAHTVTSN